MHKLTFWSMVIFVAGLVCPAFAAVDLVTLPTRQGTQLTIYNSEDISMVREHRLLTVKEGVNRIQFSWANTLIVLWGPDGRPKDWDSQEPGAYVDLHNVPVRVERVDQQHVKYSLDLQPGKKQLASYSVTYKRRKVGPELNTERKREPL